MATEVESRRLVEDDASAAGHRYNDDLLVNPGDFDRAQKAFPSVAHVLDHPALRDEFQRFDLPANAAKKRSRVAGLFAIGAGAVSLALAAATPVYRGSPHIWVFGLIAAFLGVAVDFDRLWRRLVRRRQTPLVAQSRHDRATAPVPFSGFRLPVARDCCLTQRNTDYKGLRRAASGLVAQFLATFPVRLDSGIDRFIGGRSPSRCWLLHCPDLRHRMRPTAASMNYFPPIATCASCTKSITLIPNCAGPRTCFLGHLDCKK